MMFGHLFFASKLWAQNKCIYTLINRPQEIAQIVREDAFEQWGIWERTLNHYDHGQRGHEIIMLTRLHVPLNETRIEYIPGMGTPALWRLIGPQQQTRPWLNNMYDNTNENPFRDYPRSSAMPAQMSASRSMILQGELRGYTVKMGTDRPAGDYGGVQPKKAIMTEEVKLAVRRSRFIHEIDTKIGESPHLAVLKDVALVAHHERPYGYVIRDNRLLDSGNYYIPAFSIPFVGHAIAALHKADLGEFWGLHYAKALGRAKALFLLRYGLQLTNPNTQNILVEVDRNLMPTGRIVFRDMTDTDYIVGVSDRLGFHEEMIKDEREAMPPVSELKPYTSLSFAGFNDGGSRGDRPGAVPTELVNLRPAYMSENSTYGQGVVSWIELHNNAYIETLSQELGVPVEHTPLRQATSRMAVTYESLKTPQVQ